MTTRVILHAGFHKTGTSSLQRYLRGNLDLLRPYLAYYDRDDFPQLAAALQTYGKRPFPWRIRQVRRAATDFLARIPDDKVIVLSRETFSGTLPGHRRLFGALARDYPQTAIPIGKVMVTALRHRFGPHCKVEFLYTLRSRDAWLRSVHGHLLRAIRMTDSFAQFSQRFAALPDLDATARHIAQHLSLDALHLAQLEDVSASPAGPAASVLDLLDLPNGVKRQLPPAPRANVGQNPAIAAEFLRLNRANRDKVALKRQKDRLLRKAPDG